MTTVSIELPLQKTISEAMMKNEYNQQQIISALTNFHNKYNEKHGEEYIEAFKEQDIDKMKPYIIERSKYMYRYFTINYPKIRTQAKKIELELFNPKPKYTEKDFVIVCSEGLEATVKMYQKEGDTKNIYSIVNCNNITGGHGEKCKLLNGNYCPFAVDLPYKL